MTLIQKICTENPAWMFFSRRHQCESLSSFPKKTLLSILKILKLNIATRNVHKKCLIDAIVKSFENRCLELTMKSDGELLDLCYTNSLIVNKLLRSTIIATIIIKEYGSEIFYYFCKPDESNLNINLTEACDLTWLHLDETSSISYNCLSSASIKAIFMQLHPAQRPTIGKFFKEL